MVFNKLPEVDANVSHKLKIDLHYLEEKLMTSPLKKLMISFFELNIFKHFLRSTSTKIVRKRYYPENHIHCTFYCEFTERQFELHTVVIREHYEGYKPFILDAYTSLICHE